MLRSNTESLPAADGALMPADMAEMAKKLYSGERSLARLKQQFRPYICPFHLLMDLVPDRSHLLDIGCGSGLFIGLLSSLGKLSSAQGFDSDPAAISVANSMQLDSPPESLVFEFRDADGGMPDGQYSVVSLIDVLHHVPPQAHESVIEQALRRVAPGGRFIYKDMVSRPKWRALANRTHDLLLAGDWIHYFDAARVGEISADAGFKLVESGHLNMLWYGHEWYVFERPAAA